MDIVILGGGGHAKVVVDVIEAVHPAREPLRIIGFLDDDPAAVLGVFPRLGELDSLARILEAHASAWVICAIGSNRIREQVVAGFEERIAGIRWGSFIHPSAVISPSALIGQGTVIMPHAVVNAEAFVGAHCIVNTGAVVEHECVVDDFAHVSPNATLCGKVRVGRSVHVGAGATVIPGVRIGSMCVVGAGSVVVRDVPGHTTVKGVPAR